MAYIGIAYMVHGLSHYSTFLIDNSLSNYSLSSSSLSNYSGDVLAAGTGLDSASLTKVRAHLVQDCS